MEDKEQVYDERIEPLVAEIVRICQTEGIPFFASFRLNDGDPDSIGDESSPLHSTTFIPIPGIDAEALRDAFRCVYQGWKAVPPRMATAVGISRKVSDR